MPNIEIITAWIAIGLSILNLIAGGVFAVVVAHMLQRTADRQRETAVIHEKLTRLLADVEHGQEKTTQLCEIVDRLYAEFVDLDKRVTVVEDREGCGNFRTRS